MLIEQVQIDPSTGPLEASCLSQETIDIEWFVKRQERSVWCSGPLLLWPIPIYLHSIAIGIAEINGFACSMVSLDRAP